MRLAVSERKRDPRSFEFLNVEAELDQGRTAVFGELLPVQQVRDREPEGQCEAGLEKGSAFEVDQDRGIRDQNVHGDRR